LYLKGQEQVLLRSLKTVGKEKELVFTDDTANMENKKIFLEVYSYEFMENID
jgi:hypothetical protein